MRLLPNPVPASFRETYAAGLEEHIAAWAACREAAWTEGLAVGSTRFVEPVAQCHCYPRGAAERAYTSSRCKIRGLSVVWRGLIKSVVARYTVLYIAKSSVDGGVMARYNVLR